MLSSAINNGGADEADDGDGDDPPTMPSVVEFSDREDVERLLAEKIKGRNKNDFMVTFFFEGCMIGLAFVGSLKGMVS